MIRRHSNVQGHPLLLAEAALAVLSILGASSICASPQSSRLTALVTRVSGAAEIEPPAPAAPRPLRQFQMLTDDEPLRIRQGTVTVVCSDDRVLRLVAPKNWRLSKSGCQEGALVPGLFRELAPRLSRSSRHELAVVVEGGVRGDEATREILLSPRRTAVTTPRPNLIWRRIEGAEHYQIEIPGLGDEVWLAAEEVACADHPEWPGLEVCEAPLPDSFEDLVPGQVVYPKIGFLKGLAGQPQQEDFVASLELLPTATARAVERRVAALAGLAPAERHALAGMVYAKAGLRALAIREYRQALAADAASEDRHHLGQLYLGSGLLSHAERELKAVLAAPETTDGIRAAATWGLARIAFAEDQLPLARERAQAAALLFRAAGSLEEAAGADDLALRALARPPAKTQRQERPMRREER